MKKWALLLVVLLMLMVAAVLLDPTGVSLGFLRGESFFHGRPTGYWARLLSDNSAGSVTAIEQLEQGQGQAVGVLSELIRKPRFPSPARYTAVEILGKIGPEADAAGDVLLAALSDPDPHVRTVAAASLPKIGVPADRAVPALIQRLEAEPGVVAARALSEYRGQALAALPVLVEILRNKDLDSETRWNAARTLGKIGPDGTAAVPALVENLQDQAPTVREHAAEALGDIGPPAGASVPALVAVLGDSATRVRRDAVRSLGQIGPASRVAVAQIKDLLNDPEVIVRVAARDALRAIAPEELPAEKPKAKSGEPKGKKSQ